MENVMTARAMTREEMDREIDLAVAGSFPASDPPPWTLGATPPALPEPHSPAAIAPAAIDVVIAAGRGRRRATTVVEVMAMTALVPVGVLIAAAPILLAVWAFGAVAAWVLGGR
jgi:hypothetical protein